MLQIPGESYPDALSPLTVEEQQLARDLEGDVKEIAPEPHKLPFPIPIITRLKRLRIRSIMGN